MSVSLVSQRQRDEHQRLTATGPVNSPAKMNRQSPDRLAKLTLDEPAPALWRPEDALQPHVFVTFSGDGDFLEHVKAVMRMNQPQVSWSSGTFCFARLSRALLIARVQSLISSPPYPVSLPAHS